ncbi:NUDIX domain-containing protein [Sphingorhabdus sp. Alg239-R122]|uniref:NUDIX domain-containing protein n=1 Tax=Sphingorhabdus sp. Alg239-R122 TaxID=2305989 RepID=UPI0013DD81B4|nr:NUDIX domain-containing protein [Sphingorhabdus sp. Alg239-R122]
MHSIKPIHLAYRIAQQLRLAYWHIAKPALYGAKIMAFNDAGELLLIRHSYGKSHLYMLPGGGVHRGEDPENAAVRELREETGCTAHDVKLLGEYLDTSRGAQNHVHVYTARTQDTPKADGREILEARYFALDALPARTSQSVRRRLADMQCGGPETPNW